MPEFLKVFFNRESPANQKFLNYEGLQHLVKRLKQASCKQLLAPTSSEEGSTFHLSNSIHEYKSLIIMLTLEHCIKHIVTVPISIVETGREIEIACPVDFGEMSAHIRYLYDHTISIKTSLASVEIWGSD